MRLSLAVVAFVGLLPAPALGQNFGSAVAVAGGDILIGEPLNQYGPGKVHVFRRAAGGWRIAAELAAPDGHPLDRFGRSLSTDGSRLLVGSTSIDSSRGAAFVFERGGAGAWRQVAKLVPGSASLGEAWGRQVLLRGDVAFVASWGWQDGRGAVAVFRRSATGRWEEQAVLAAAGGGANSFFGAALAASSDLLVIGAFLADSARGAAHVFRRAGAGWVEAATLRGEGLSRNARFGAAVTVVGGDVLVGAPGADGGRGEVFGFRQSGDKWTAHQRLSVPEGAAQAQFGSTIDWDGTELWIGAPRAAEIGRVFRYSRGADGALAAVGVVTFTDVERGDGFGTALARAGATAVVGMPGDDHGAGTAVILARTGDAWGGGDKVWTEPEGLAAVTGGKRECGEDRQTEGFACEGVDLLAFLPIAAIGGRRGVDLNDVWGWTDPTTGREYAVVGRIDGTSFVDVTDPERPRYLGDLPKTAASPASSWRDIKVYRDHAFIVADGAEAHGMQVFDLARLRGVTAPQTFTPDVQYDRIHSAHNIVIDTAAGLAFAVGASSGGETCGGALHMIDIREPKAPRFAGCFADVATGNQRTGYTHDAQCVRYEGPDETYRGRSVCFNASENAVGIADVTDPSQPKAIARVSYPNVAYTHQGWLTDDQHYLYVNDEGDESGGLVPGTRTLIFDVSDLDDPVYVGAYVSANKAIDHNLYVRGDLVYESNYSSGLRILDISDREHPKEVGFFDTRPVGGDTPEFTGSWSNYPFFASGTVVVTSIGEGLFLLRRASRPPIP